MALRFDVLPQVLYQPKQAFEKIKAGTTAVDGIIMALILMIVAQVIAQLPKLSNLGSAAGMFTLLGVPALGVIILALIGAVSARIAGGKKDARKTIGLIGYVSILSVVLSIISLAVPAALEGLRTSITGYLTASLIGNAAAAATTGMGLALLVVFDVLALLVVFAIWALWIYGSAVAAANEVTLGRGVVSYLVAAILVLTLIGVLSTIALWLWIGYIAKPIVPLMY